MLLLLYVVVLSVCQIDLIKLRNKYRTHYHLHPITVHYLVSMKAAISFKTLLVLIAAFLISFSIPHFSPGVFFFLFFYGRSVHTKLTIGSTIFSDRRGFSKSYLDNTGHTYNPYNQQNIVVFTPFTSI